MNLPFPSRLRSLRVLAAALLLAGASALRAADNEVRILSFFRGTGDGLHFSFSTDALHWAELNGVFLKSRIGGKLFRDPFILPSPDGVYRMVWTSGWKDRGVGYAQSTDLIHWTEPRFLPLMQAFPATNCWAPKLLHDPATGLYRIYWTSAVEGWFTEDAPKSGEYNNRTFQATTRDFVSFSEPSLLIEPGFDHNDPNIVAWRGGYLATFKQGDFVTEKQWGSHFAATATQPGGPYKLVPTPIIAGQRSDSIGLAIVGDRLIYYVKRHTPRQFAAYASVDGRTWTDITATVGGDPNQNQGNIFTVPASVLTQLQAAAPAR